jgi:hypothetical protein
VRRQLALATNQSRQLRTTLLHGGQHIGHGPRRHNQLATARELTWHPIEFNRHGVPVYHVLTAFPTGSKETNWA